MQSWCRGQLVVLVVTCRDAAGACGEMQFTLSRCILWIFETLKLWNWPLGRFFRCTGQTSPHSQPANSLLKSPCNRNTVCRAREIRATELSNCVISKDKVSRVAESALARPTHICYHKKTINTSILYAIEILFAGLEKYVQWYCQKIELWNCAISRDKVSRVAESALARPTHICHCWPVNCTHMVWEWCPRW